MLAFWCESVDVRLDITAKPQSVIYYITRCGFCPEKTGTALHREPDCVILI